MKGYLGVCLLATYAADVFKQHLKVIIVLLRSKYGFFLPFYLVFYQQTFLVISSAFHSNCISLIITKTLC